MIKKVEEKEKENYVVNLQDSMAQTLITNSPNLEYCILAHSQLCLHVRQETIKFQVRVNFRLKATIHIPNTHSLSHAHTHTHTLTNARTQLPKTRSSCIVAPFSVVTSCTYTCTHTFWWDRRCKQRVTIQTRIE